MTVSEPGRIRAAFRGSLGGFRLEASFSVPATGVTAIFGPSGCGKTTVAAVGRLHSAIESELVDGSDTQFKERIQTATTKRDGLRVQLECFMNIGEVPQIVTTRAINDFIEIVGSKLAEPGPVPARKACLRQIIDHVDVDTGEVKIWGRQDILRAVIASGPNGTSVPSSV
jgi:ABC-type glutathione transport system ATPase component